MRNVKPFLTVQRPKIRVNVFYLITSVPFNCYEHTCVCLITGTSGSPIELRANFVRLMSRPEWVLYQYHVDFNPPMESRRLRVALIHQQEETLGPARSFDGAILFLPHRLPDAVHYELHTNIRHMHTHRSNILDSHLKCVHSCTVFCQELFTPNLQFS